MNRSKFISPSFFPSICFLNLFNNYWLTNLTLSIKSVLTLKLKLRSKNKCIVSFSQDTRPFYRCRFFSLSVAYSLWKTFCSSFVNIQTYISVTCFVFSWCPKTGLSLWIREKFQRQDHILFPAQHQHLLSDVASFWWIRGALLGKSPAPLVLTQTLPALDQTFIWLCCHRCWGEDQILLLFF